MQRGDRAAERSLRRNVADHQTASSAAEAPVGEQRDGVSQPLADNRSGHAQHLAHARATLRPFVADHNHVSGFDLLAGDGCHGRLLGIKNASRPAMCQALMATDLHHTALGRDIAVQDHQAASLLQRMIERRDHRLARCLFRGVRFFPESAPGHGHGRSVGELAVEQALRNHRNAAGLVDVSRHIFARGFQIRQHGSALADLLEVIDRQRHTHLARDCQQMQHGIRRPTGARDSGNCVFEGGAGEDLLGQNFVL